MDIENPAMSKPTELSRLCEGLPKRFKITKHGASDLASELDNFIGFDDPEYQKDMERNRGFFVLRMKGYIFNFMLGEDYPHLISILATARDWDKKVNDINEVWDLVCPDAAGFYTAYTGYAAHGGREHGQEDSEYLNRFEYAINHPVYHGVTGEYLYNIDSCRAGPLHYLELLPGLTWRIAMGEHHFEKFNISREEISKVCVSTEETTALNGDKIWKFQSRHDPLDWRDSLDRQLKLDRPDVFFDITPLRERFSTPADIKDSGRGDELVELFKRTLKELYPEKATQSINV